MTFAALQSSKSIRTHTHHQKAQTLSLSPTSARQSGREVKNNDALNEHPFGSYTFPSRAFALTRIWGVLMIRLNRYLHNGNVLLVCRLRRRWSLAPRWKRRSRYLFTPTLANGEKYRRRGLAWPRRASRPLPGGERSRSIERPTNPFPGSGSALLLGSARAFSPRGPPKGSAGAAMAAMAGCYCCCTQKIRQESSFWAHSSPIGMKHFCAWVFEGLSRLRFCDFSFRSIGEWFSFFPFLFLIASLSARLNSGLEVGLRQRYTRSRRI